MREVVCESRVDDAAVDATMILSRRPAMGTWFEVHLAGDNSEHLAAVGEAVLDDIERLDELFSRFDPAAELYRINRAAAAGAVLVDPELFDVLTDCLAWHERTGGYFNPVATRDARDSPPGTAIALPELMRLHGRRVVEITTDEFEIDLGGYAKGYALDAAARRLKEFGIGSAFVHGGGSSAWATGREPGGRPWSVAVQHPGAFEEAAPLAALELDGAAFSCSATQRTQEGESDIVDPTTGRPIKHAALCVVIADTALSAEVISTALLAMGRGRAAAWLERAPLLACPAGPGSAGASPSYATDLCVGWADLSVANPKLVWL